MLNNLRRDEVAWKHSKPKCDYKEHEDDVSGKQSRVNRIEM
jgi:hypothetical protein